MYRCRREVMHAPHVEPVGLLKDAAVGSQVATSGVDLEIPFGPPWIKRTPLLGAPTIDKRCSAVLRGVSHEDRLIGGGARDQEPDGDTRRRDSDLDKFGSSDRRNTLHPVSLVYCIEMYVDQSLVR